MVIAILFAAYLLEKELKRKNQEGLLSYTLEPQTIGKPASVIELLITGLMGFIVFSKVVYVLLNLEAFKPDPAGMVFSLEGNLLAGILGAVLFAGLKYNEKKKELLPEPKEVDVKIYPHQRIAEITMLAAVSGVVGAKLFALGEDLSKLIKGETTWDIMVAQFFSTSGLAIYGGLIMGFICVAIYLRWKKVPVIHVMDAIAPSLIIAYGIGRLGCQVSGDGDWGINIEALNSAGELVQLYTQPGFIPDWLWGQTYPNNVAQEGVAIAGCEFLYCKELPFRVFPTPLYETIACFSFGGFLWWLRKRITIPGLLFFIYLIFNGIERFTIEKIRINPPHNYFGFQSTQAEFIAVILFTIGVIGAGYLWWKGKK